MTLRIAASGDPGNGGDFLRFLKQHGVDDIVVGGKSGAEALRRFPPDQGDTPGLCWGSAELVDLRRMCEEAGLRVAAIENPVPPWCVDKIMLGLPGRDIQIDNLVATIRNMARAGIMTFGYHWMVNPPGVTRASFRTSSTTPGRGSALVESFDLDLTKHAPLFRDREYSAEEMWANYAYFVRAIVPVLEETGVRMALHPDDPPVGSLGGIPRLFNGPAGFERAMQLSASERSGLNLCLGNWTAMGTDIAAAVRHFGSRGQIFYGHAQGVQGTVPSFRECFLDEADCRFLDVFEALEATGFDGVLVPGHFPHPGSGAAPERQELSFAIGYLRGLLQAVYRQGVVESG